MAAFNFDLMGIGDDVVFGKDNPRIQYDGIDKLQVRDNADAAFANLAGADAVAANDFVTLQQLQSFSAGLSWKNPARVGAPVDITVAAPGAAIDTVALNAGDRVLLLNQAAPAENGIWVWNGAAVAMTRPTDYAAGSTQNAPALFVEEGPTYADTAWVGTADPITVDVTSPLFIQFASVAGGVTSVVSVGGGVSLVNNSGPPTAEIRSLTSPDASIDIALNATEVELEVDVDLLVGVVATRIAGFTQATASPFNIGTALPATALVLRTQVNVDTAFDNGSGADLEIGTGADPDQLMTTTENALEIVGLYLKNNHVAYPIATQLIGTLNSAGSAAGSGTVVVEFVRQS